MAWYDEVFDGLYDQFTFHIFTERRNRQEAEFIRDALELRPGDSVLDAACGHGRHAIPLAGYGIKVTGVDITARYISMAKKAAGGLPAQFMVGDLRALKFRNRFDAAYSFFTSFGFYDDHTNFDILWRLTRALKPDGRLLIDTRNREQFGPGNSFQQEHFEFEQDGRELALLTDSNIDYETGRVEVDMRLFGLEDGPKTMKFTVRLYTMPELCWLLSQAGLEVIRKYGDCDGSIYSAISSRCIVVAQKAGKSGG